MEGGSRRVQYLAATAASLFMIYQGVILSWPSPALPKLRSNETEVLLSKEQSSWVVSLVTVGGLPGCVLAQVLAERVGRKRTILAAAVPAALASGIAVWRSEAGWLYAARFLAGLGGGMVVVVVSIYVTEIADKGVRGALGTLLQAMANVGNLLMYGAGPFVSYRTLNLLVLAVPFCCLAACAWLPESPYYLLRAGRPDHARRALQRLRGLGDSKPLEDELAEMEAHVASSARARGSVLELLTRREYRRALYVVTGLKVLQQMTGTIAIQSYLETIFRQSSAAVSGPFVSILYGIVQLFAGLAATLLADRVGRRPLLLASSLGVGAALTAVGLFFFLRDSLQLPPATLAPAAPLALVGILAFNVMYAVGLGTLPYLMQAELFPTGVKAVASSVATMFGAALAFIVAKSYEGLSDALGVHTVFWMFAGVGYAGGVFIYLVVPETKGRSPHEIQAQLQGGVHAEDLPLQACAPAPAPG